MTVRTRSLGKRSASPSSSSSSSSSQGTPVSTSPSSPPTPGEPAPSETTPLVRKHTPLPPNHPHRRRVFHRKPRLLTFAESVAQVPWQTDNEYVTRGYRPQLYNVRACLWSAIGYVHNETVNIHSHSIGALFFAVLLPMHVASSQFPNVFGAFPDPTTLPPTTIIDKAALACYCVAAVTCLGLSSWFHTVQCCSKDVCDLAHCGDYIGIVVLIVGSILPGMYYGFHDNPILQALYMIGITAAGITSAYVVLSPHHRNHRWDRTLTFIALGLSAVVPVGHVVLAKGLSYARQMMGFDYIVAGGASYIAGALLYAGRIPESLWPGKFDFFGSSHQIFHCFALLGAWFQFSALRWMVVGKATA